MSKSNEVAVMSIEDTLRLALEALEHGLDYAKSEQFENAQRYKGYESLAPDDAHSIQLIEAAITSLRQAIAEAEKQEQGEPVAWPMEHQPDGSITPVDPADMTPEQLQFYTTPQQRAHLPESPM